MKAILLTLILVLSGTYLYLHRPNLYDRTRSDLLEASRQLDIYHSDMEALVQEQQRSAEALRAAIAWLQKAVALDPHDKEEVKSITDELLRWEQQARSGKLSSGELRESYLALVGRLDRMIKKHTEMARAR